MPTLAICQLYRGIWKYFESMPFTLMCFSSPMLGSVHHQNLSEKKEEDILS
jgi:hypothetical protein